MPQDNPISIQRLFRSISPGDFKGFINPHNTAISIQLYNYKNRMLFAIFIAGGLFHVGEFINFSTSSVAFPGFGITTSKLMSEWVLPALSHPIK